MRKVDRTIREEHIVYHAHQTMASPIVWHATAYHVPSGYNAVATERGDEETAKYEARERLQVILEARWLSSLSPVVRPPEA